MVHACHIACTATQQSIGPLTAPALLMWLKDGRSYFPRGYVSIAPAPTKLNLVTTKWHVRNAAKSITHRFVAVNKGLKDC